MLAPPPHGITRFGGSGGVLALVCSSVHPLLPVQVPEAVRQGGAEVHVLSAKPAAAADLAAPGLAGGTPLQPGSRDFAMLWPRMKQAQLVAALQPLSQTRVLVIRHVAGPGRRQHGSAALVQCT